MESLIRAVAAVLCLTLCLPASPERRRIPPTRAGRHPMAAGAATTSPGAS